jgi:hypothetical protein
MKLPRRQFLHMAAGAAGMPASHYAPRTPLRIDAGRGAAGVRARPAARHGERRGDAQPVGAGRPPRRVRLDLQSRRGHPARLPAVVELAGADDTCDELPPAQAKKDIDKTAAVKLECFRESATIGEHKNISPAI